MTTKSKILYSASQLFAQYGYDSASVRLIAGKVGIRESAIYNHFENKNAILNQYFVRNKKYSNPSNLLSEPLIQLLDKPKKFLSAFIKEALSKWDNEEERIFFTILYRENGKGNLPKEYSLIKYEEQFENVIAFIFSEMMKHKFIKKGDEKFISKLLVSRLLLFRISNYLYLSECNKSELRIIKNSFSDTFYKQILF